MLINSHHSLRCQVSSARYKRNLCLLILGSLTSLGAAWAQSAPVSDDFNGSSLNTSLWQTSAPAGGTVTVSNGHANLAVPGAANHDAFVGGNNSVRILQNISNADFDVAAKFDSSVTRQYEGEGILIQQDSGTYLRLEFSSDGNGTSLSASVVSAGNQYSFGGLSVSGGGSPLWLQVQRSGASWTVTYSTDGVNYAPGITFSQNLTVSAIGPYAWNYNTTPANSPALNAAVDYFYNLATTTPTTAVPTFAPASGTTFSTTLSVAISDSTSGATIYYTTDNSTPSTSSLVYSGALSISQSTTVKAIAVAPGEGESAVSSASYIYSPGGGGGGGGAGAPVSDDFTGSSLNTSLWQPSAPAGGTVTVSNGHANLAVPGGANHDAFVGGNNSVRILQNISNADFDVAAKFDSLLSSQYEGEGIMVQQDSGTYLRLEFSSDGSVTTLFTSLVSGGNQTSLGGQSVSGINSSLWLQVLRSGNSWTVSYSTDGASYQPGITFTQSLNVSAIGPYAWNYNTTPANSPALNAAVDYFYNLATTTPTTAMPTFAPASGTTFSTTLSVAISDSTSGATIYYTTDNSTPSTSSPVYSGALSISQSTTVKAIAVAPGEGESAVSSASYIYSPGGGGGGGGAGAPVSDDFTGSSLNTSLWQPSAPAGGTVTVSNGHANLAVPGGANHDAFLGGDNSVRMLQNISNTDFDVAAKFDSAVTRQYEGEGILVQQDSGTYLRLEFSSDGNGTSLSANIVSAGNQYSFGSQSVPGGSSSLWLQVQRSGANWTVAYSTDGVNYQPGITFSQNLTVSAIGPYAWNYNNNPASSPALTAAVDYFYNLSGGGTTPLAISNVSASAAATTATITWTTNLSATSAVQYGTTTNYGQSASNSTAVTSHSQALTGLSCGTTYNYQVSSTAGTQTIQSSNSTFQTTSCGGGGGGNGGPVSDNFDSPSLNTTLWTFVNPTGDAVLTMNGSAATINLPAQTTHDPWTGGNGSVRLMQNISNSNFQVQVRFQSNVEIGNQDEGILVQQDANDFLRLDVLNDGTNVRLFAAGIEGNNATVFTSGVINVSQAPIWLQLQRTGNNWVGAWSTDGVNFNAGFSANFALTVNSIGPFAGNANSDVSNSPAFTAIVDYFFNLSSPLSNQDGPSPFQAITVEANPPSTLVEKTLADIRGTGHLNPVAGFEPVAGPGIPASNGGIYWYEYPASGVLTDPWIKNTVVSDGQAYEDMAPLDVNNDGAVDIVASYEPVGSDTLYLVWFENPRGHGGDPATDPWTMHTIGPGSGENSLVLGDFDGDGKPDVATGAYIFFQNTPDSWTQVQYNNAFRGVALFDIGSGKGKINLVSAGGPLVPATSSYNTVWFENPRETGGNARTGQWIMHVIGSGYPCNDSSCPGGDFYIATFGTGDLDGDGRMDVIMGQSEGPFGVAPPPGGLVWFEAPADRRNGSWTRHTINANFVATHNVRVADMDQNGTLDLVTAEQDQAPLRRVAVFYNDGFGNFKMQVVSNAAGHQTGIGDVAGNGAIDILSSGHGYEGMIHPVQIFLNPVR